MASRLVNLQRQLVWTDFGTPREGDNPAPGTTATAAQMRVTHRHTVNGETAPGTRPPRVRLKDDVTIEVILQPSQIFVNAWVFRQPQSFQDDVLHHEQGHYDMVALCCRDMFVEFMELKTQTFAQGRELISAIERIMSTHDALITSVHTPYDTNTHHGRDSAQQQLWDRLIQSAFTQPRSPAVIGSDGTPNKVRLDVTLRGAGITL